MEGAGVSRRRMAIYHMNTDAVGVRPVIGLCFRRLYEMLFFKFLGDRILMPEYKVHLLRGRVK